MHDRQPATRVRVLWIELRRRKRVHERAANRIRSRVHLEAVLAKIHVGEERVRVSRQRIELHGPFEKLPRLGVHLRTEHPRVAPRPEKTVVGVQLDRALLQRALQSDVLHRDAERRGNRPRHLVLQLENIAHLAVVAVAPELNAGGAVNQLHRDAHAPGRAPDAALDDVPGLQPLADFPRLKAKALDLQGRRARDHPQVTEARQVGDDVLRQPVGEILVDLRTEVGERHHRKNRARRLDAAGVRHRIAASGVASRSRHVGGEARAEGHHRLVWRIRPRALVARGGHRSRELEAAPPNRSDVTRDVSAVPERPARRLDAAGDRGVGDRPAPPHPVDDFLAPDDASRVGGEEHDEIEHQGLDVLCDTAEAEFVPVGVDLELIKPVTHRVSRRPTLRSRGTFLLLVPLARSDSPSQSPDDPPRLPRVPSSNRPADRPHLMPPEPTGQTREPFATGEAHMTPITATATPDYSAIKAKQNAAWSSGDYSRIGVTLQIVGESLAETMDLRPGASVLDVAAGNGNATLAFARRMCVVTSTDYVDTLLVRGRARAEADWLDVKYEIADAEQLPYDDGTFDGVVSTFGVMFAPNQDKAASELLRVCRPNGKIGLANWTPAGFIGELFKTLGKHVAPPIGLSSPARWGTESWITQTFGPPARAIAIEHKAFVFRYPSPENFIDVFRAFYGPIHKAFLA